MTLGDGKVMENVNRMLLENYTALMIISPLAVDYFTSILMRRIFSVRKCEST